ncbi:MAG: hypothetical protein ACK46X_20810, partial [Candidatus Sericytochromatia bacterium]
SPQPVSGPVSFPSPPAARPSVGPPIHVSPGPQGYIVPVGEAVEIAATASAAPPIWSILPDDRENAELVQTLDTKGQTMTARVTVGRPGLVHLRANVGGNRAEVELAGIDTPTVEMPTILAVPAKLPTTIRLITSQADWQAFWDELRAADPARRPESPMPMDFTERAVVAVVAYGTKGLGGPPVVTHVIGRDIHVAFSGEKEPHVTSGLTPQRATVIQPIPRVPQDARFVISGSLYRVELPSKQEVVDIETTQSPKPSPSPLPSSR